MVGSKNLISAVIMILLLTPGCSTSQKTDINTIQKEMVSTRNFINRNIKNISQINNRKTGKTGFYYVIDLEGTILSHPRGLLVGSSFRRYSFIRKIIQMRSGCIRYDTGEIQQMVFFIPLHEESILCLSIPADEVKNYRGGCKGINP
jgi:hypothetical protein